MKKLILLLTGFTLSVLTFSSIAFANGNVSITRLNPDPSSKNNTWFNFESPANKVIEDSVLIKNMSNEKITVKILAIDTAPNKAGRFILKRNNETQETIGAWTTLEKNTLELEPLQSQPIKFQINIPSDIKSGEYSGGIIVEETKSSDTKSVITARIGNRIYLKIPGNLKQDLSWVSFSTQPDHAGISTIFDKEIYFKFILENKGNTLLRPSITIDVFNIFGQKVSTISKELGEFQPGTTSEPVIKWTQRPIFGMFTAKATITSIIEKQKTQSITKEVSINIVPWKILILSIFTIICLILSYFLFKKKDIPQES